jgi:2-polyprenyl-3-methyl-5-hydroxy-6-metoxy-1,4-benzoquinol methylase
MNKKYYRNVRHDVLELIPQVPYQRILEIGGGEFPTLFELNKSQNAELWGVDIFPCKKKNLKFIKGSIESHAVKSQLPNNYFDLIIANDVVEHLVDTDAFIHLVRQKLKPGGLFITSIPNIRQIRTFFYIFLKGTFPRHDAGLFDKTHLRWFCKSDVIAIANKNNLEIADIKSVGRMVPRFIEKTSLVNFLALQHIFLFKKK